MRRASIVGPIIIIGLGILFLLRNLYPQLALMEFLSQYWPFVLMLWGGLRLLEILFWTMNRKPLPLNGISGGEWVLVIFLCLIGFGAHEARHASWFPNRRMHISGLEMFGEAFDYPLATQEKTVGKNGRLVIESFRGNARISGVDGDVVKVSGRKSIRALRQEDANSANQASPLELVVNGDQVIVRTNQDRAGTDQSRVNEDLEITVPKSLALEAVGRYGDFDISDMGGNVEIVSDNAGVRLQNIGGNLRVETRRSDIVRATGVKGSVELKGGGTDLELQDITGPVTVVAKYSGTVQFRNVSKPVRFESDRMDFNAEAIPGQMRMTLSDLTGDHLVGPVRLNARSKDVQISDFTQNIDVTVERGDIELRPGKGAFGKMEIHTNAGAIDLALPDQAKLLLSANTASGEITNDYNPAFQERSEGHGASLKGSNGEGPRVNLTTRRGSITIRKASEQIAATPPKAPAVPKPPQPIEQ
jgi:hypothetical protein